MLYACVCVPLGIHTHKHTSTLYVGWGTKT